MLTACMKCGKSSALAFIDDTTACPACGAIFSKVASAIAANEERRPEMEKAQLVLEERSKKKAAFRKKFEPVTNFVKLLFRKLGNVGQAIVRNTPRAFKFVSRVASLTIKLLTPVVRAILAFYGLMFMVFVAIVSAFANASPKTRKRRPRMTDSQKEMAAYQRRTSEGTPKRRKNPSAKRIGY